MNIPNMPLKVAFFLHFLLTVWAIQGSWLPLSYLYYSFVFLLLLLWGIHSRESEEPIFMALMVDLGSIVLDSISIGLYYPQSDHISHELRFSIVMSVLNLLLRLGTAFLLLRVYNERSGRYSNFGIPGFVGRGPYEDIDQPIPQSVPKTPVDTGSPSRTQIPDSRIMNQYSPP